MIRDWSKFQLAAFEHVATSKKHLIVSARAGSGKSTTILEMTRRVPARKSILVCCFNKGIAEAMRKVVDKRVKVLTFNGIGHLAIDKLAKGYKLDKWRQKKIVSQVLPNARLIPISAFSDVEHIVNMCMSRLASDLVSVDKVMRDYDFLPENPTFEPLYVKWALEVLEKSKEVTDVVSYNDQIWLPTALGLAVTPRDYVFVDEMQDVNPAQESLIKKALKPTGKLIAVGDERQAIYAFRGAGTDTMSRIQKLFDADVLPLSITYRCPTRVVNLVNPIVPDLEAAPGSPTGLLAVKGEAEFLSGVRLGDVVISRNNASIAKYAMVLLKRNTRVRVLGKSFGGGLERLVRKLGGVDTVAMLNGLTAYVKVETEALIAADKEDKVENLKDQAETIRALSEGVRTCEELIERFGHLFNTNEEKGVEVDNTVVTFGTVHKMKGLEFDRVWMFESTFWLNSTENENLYYVAATRAKKELYLVQLPSKTGKIFPSTATTWGKV
jgi:DNA helicase II / ATP-dependent DNA helicase PcrA